MHCTITAWREKIEIEWKIFHFMCHTSHSMKIHSSNIEWHGRCTPRQSLVRSHSIRVGASVPLTAKTQYFSFKIAEISRRKSARAHTHTQSKCGAGGINYPHTHTGYAAAQIFALNFKIDNDNGWKMQKQKPPTINIGENIIFSVVFAFNI